MKNPDDLAGGPVVSGEGGDLGVSRHLSAGDRLDHAFDPFFKFHCLAQYPEQTDEVPPKHRQAFS